MARSGKGIIEFQKLADGPIATRLSDKWERQLQLRSR
jgi:hypothetical protein